MTIHPNSHSVSDRIDPELVRLFEEIHDRLVSGESVDVEAYVARVPREAAAIRQHVALVRAMVSMGDETTGVETDSEFEIVRKEIGEFTIVREIGRGGMGVVYEAEQSALQRRVALKVLPLANLASDRQLDRFRNEARAVASLHHPHIVSIYSIGREQGVHYFAMQLIDGPSLAEVVRQLQADHEPPRAHSRTSLSARERAGRQKSRPLTQPFPEGERGIEMRSDPVDAQSAQVETRRDLQAAISTERSTSRADYFRTVARWGAEAADALAHAHERGILHRDIKPANLLIDEDRRLWVTDFGLARLESEQSLSASADIVGTLRYMSPEQAMGRRELVDHRSDIYSLGITLYELLALQPAYHGSDRQELLESVISHHSPDLRKADGSIPRELELIISKATERDREDRYSSAQELANDLRAFLDDRPIQARPLTVWQRSARWVRRHQRTAAATVAALAILAVVLTGVTAFVVHQRQVALNARANSDANFALAEEAVNQLFTRVSDNVLLNQPQMEELRATLLEDALRFYEKLAHDSANSPRARQQSAAAQVKLGHILLLLDRRDEAYDALQSGTDRLRELIKADPKNQTMLLEMGRGLRALSEAARLKTYRIMLGDSEQTKLEEQAKQARGEAIEALEAMGDRSNAQSELLLSYLYLDEGDTYDKHSEARRRLHRQAIDAAERAIAISPTPEAELQRLMCQYEFFMGSDREEWNRDDYVVRKAFFEAAERLVKDNPEYAEAKYFLSCVYGNQACNNSVFLKPDARNRSVSLAQELHEQYPMVDRYTWGLAMEYRNKATRDALDGAKWEEVEAARRSSIGLLEGLCRKQPMENSYVVRLIDNLRELGELYRFRCDNESRVSVYQSYIDVVDQWKWHPESGVRAEGFYRISETRTHLATVLYPLGRVDEAREQIRLAREACRGVLDNIDHFADDPSVFRLVEGRGRFGEFQSLESQMLCESVWGDLDLLKSLTQEALQMLDEFDGLSIWDTDAHNHLKARRALVLCTLGHPNLQQPEKAVELMQELLLRVQDNPAFHLTAGRALFASGRYEEAEPIFRERREAKREEDRQRKARQALKRQMVELCASDPEEAVPLYHQMMKIDVKEPNGRGEALGWPETPEFSLYLSIIAFHRGDETLAKQEFNEVRARWGSCETFPEAARLYRQAAALLGESTASVAPTALPVESPLPIVESLGGREWRGVQ